MSTLPTNPPPALRPPRWQWGDMNLAWQAFLAAALGAVMLFLLYIGAEAATGFSLGVLYVVVHELFHALGALVQNGTVSAFIIDPEGGGHVVAASRDPVLTAAAGPVGPAWLAALLFYLAVTRQANALMLVTIGLALFLVAFYAAENPKVAWALYAWAAIGIIGLSPAGPLIKSAALHVFGFALTFGVLGSIRHLDVARVDGEPARPSDTEIIASALGGASIPEVRHVLVFAMMLGALLAVVGVVNWLARHSR